MTLLVLDTDYLSLFQRGNTAILPRIRAIPPAQMAISIVSVEEMLQGRLAQVRRAGIGEDRIRAYAWLEKTLTFVRAFRVLPFDDQAERRYVDFAARRLRIGAQDLKIAAIARSVTTPPSSPATNVTSAVLPGWTSKTGRSNEHLRRGATVRKTKIPSIRNQGRCAAKITVRRARDELLAPSP